MAAKIKAEDSSAPGESPRPGAEEVHRRAGENRERRRREDHDRRHLDRHGRQMKHAGANQKTAQGQNAGEQCGGDRFHCSLHVWGDQQDGELG